MVVSPFSRIYIYIYILENGETIREKSGNLFHQIEWAPCTDTFVNILWMAQIGLCHIIESYLKFVYRPGPFSS